MIYFDFFNVLSTPAYKPVVTKYVPEHERPQWEQKIDRVDLGELPEHVFIGELAKYSGVSEHALSQEIDGGIELNQQLIAYIQTELKPNYKIGLLTNAARSLIEHLFTNYLDIFDTVIISSDYGVVKPNPQIYAIAIKDADVKANDIVFVDDNPRNIDAARESGMHGIVYTNLHELKQELENHRN